MWFAWIWSRVGIPVINAAKIRAITLRSEAVRIRYANKTKPCLVSRSSTDHILNTVMLFGRVLKSNLSRSMDSDWRLKKLYTYCAKFGIPIALLEARQSKIICSIMEYRKNSTCKTRCKMKVNICLLNFIRNPLARRWFGMDLDEFYVRQDFHLMFANTSYNFYTYLWLYFFTSFYHYLIILFAKKTFN